MLKNSNGSASSAQKSTLTVEPLQNLDLEELYDCKERLHDLVLFFLAHDEIGDQKYNEGLVVAYRNIFHLIKSQMKDRCEKFDVNLKSA